MKFYLNTSPATWSTVKTWILSWILLSIYIELMVIYYIIFTRNFFIWRMIMKIILNTSFGKVFVYLNLLDLWNINMTGFTWPETIICRCIHIPRTLARPNFISLTHCWTWLFLLLITIYSVNLNISNMFDHTNSLAGQYNCL